MAKVDENQEPPPFTYDPEMYKWHSLRDIMQMGYRKGFKEGQEDERSRTDDYIRGAMV